MQDALHELHPVHAELFKTSLNLYFYILHLTHAGNSFPAWIVHKY
jgi:hypothetical protein